MPFTGKHLKSYMEFQYENMSNDNKPFAVAQNFFQISFKQKSMRTYEVVTARRRWDLPQKAATHSQNS
jgi:hypothetical protein